MLYVRVNNEGVPIEEPVTERQLKEMFPKVSFPSVLNDDTLTPIGFRCLPADPSIPQVPNSVPINDIPQLVDGKLVRKYRYEPLSETRIALKMKGIRAERNKLLQESDMSQLPDIQAKLTEQQKQAWIDYRQALRDMPANVPDVRNPVWPVAPQ